MKCVIIKVVDGRFSYYLKEHPTQPNMGEWVGIKDHALRFDNEHALDLLRDLRKRFPKDDFTHKFI